MKNTLIKYGFTENNAEIIINRCKKELIQCLLDKLEEIENYNQEESNVLKILNLICEMYSKK